MIIAMEVGPVAAPPSAARTRNAINAGALHAKAHRAVKTAKIVKPVRYTRRWP